MLVMAMDYKELFIERHNMYGETSKDSYRNQTKELISDKIINSFDRYDVQINFEDKQPCIVKDIENFKIRKFMFLPEAEIYLGDYIEHENFVYLALKQNTNDIFPYVECHHCNYEFPVRTETIKTVVGKLENGRPRYETKTIEITKPSVMIGNVYSSSDNSSLPLPEGSMTIYLPYHTGDTLPELNFKITVEQSQYKVTDIIHQNVIHFHKLGYKKGYVEIRLQREANTNVK